MVNNLKQCCFNPLQVRYKRTNRSRARSTRSGFQSLIGTLQTTMYSATLKTPFSVSIPYRYATNGYRLALSPSLLLVSIPYRYATNRLQGLWHYYQAQFQSLIGTLQTFCPDRRKRKVHMFQSLIGTLQTMLIYTQYRDAVQFQSLIGTLQTLREV